MLDFTALGSVPQALATTVAACVAWHVSTAWRKQQVSLRRQQAAEEALVAARTVMAAFNRIRNPFISTHEMIDDEGKVDMSFGQARAFKRRLTYYDADFTNLRKAVLLTEVHFGEQAAKPLRDLFAIRSQVVAAAEMLYAPESEGYEAEFKAQLRRDVMAMPRPGRPDTLGDEANQAISQLEAKLRLHLRLPGEPDPDAVAKQRRCWPRSRRC